MKKESVKLSQDLIWGLKRVAKAKDRKLDSFIREIFEFWKKYHK